MHLQELALAAVGIVVFCLIKVVYDELVSPLRGIPSPRFARFTRLWYLRAIWKGDAHTQIIQLHRNNAPKGQFYAPVVRLGPNMCSISSPDKTVYGISSNMSKSSWYEGWKHPSPERWTLFTDRDISRHNQTRKKFQAMYSLSSLVHYEGSVDTVQDVFAARLRDMADSSTAGVDFHHWLQCYAFDVVGMITFGKRFGFLDEGKDVHDCIRSLDASMVYSTLIGVYAWAHPFLYSILQRLPGSGAAGRSYLMSFVQQRISDRRAQREQAEAVDDDGPRDFLDIVLDAEKTGKKDMTEYNVFMMAISNVIAGSDTTAVSLSSIIWHLYSNPDALHRLRKELDACVASGKGTRDSIPFKEGQKLPFLQGCIKEGLRLCSATGLPLWRVVPPGGAEVLGQYLPAGTEVGINTWVAHYDEDVWGEDAAAFRPQRWLSDASSDEELKRLDEHWMPFGLGSRTCIGKNISYLEITKVVPMIVLNFDLVLDSTCRETLETSNFWFVKPTNFRVTVKHRSM